MQENNKGVIYGIETWSNTIATEYKIGKGHDEWWNKVDFSRIKKQFLDFIIRYNIYRYIKIIEAPSRLVHSVFQSIDYLHIDGSHSMLHSSEDVILYATKVRNGGIIIMDDVDWETVTPAVTILDSMCSRISCLKNQDGEDSCIFYRKII